MLIDPIYIQVTCLVAYVLVPIAIGCVAIWLDSRSTNSKYARKLALAAMLCGIVAAIVTLSLVRISKYPHTDLGFGIVLVIWFASIGGMCGAILDRVRYRLTDRRN